MQGVGTAVLHANESGPSRHGVHRQLQHGHAGVLVDLGDDEHGAAGYVTARLAREQPRRSRDDHGRDSGDRHRLGDVLGSVRPADVVLDHRNRDDGSRRVAAAEW